MYATPVVFDYDINGYVNDDKYFSGPKGFKHYPKTDLTGRFCREVASIYRHEAHRMKCLVSRFNYHVEGSPLHNEEEEEAFIQQLLYHAERYEQRAEERGAY